MPKGVSPPRTLRRRRAQGGRGKGVPVPFCGVTRVGREGPRRFPQRTLKAPEGRSTVYGWVGRGRVETPRFQCPHYGLRSGCHGRRRWVWDRLRRWTAEKDLRVGLSRFALGASSR